MKVCILGSGSGGNSFYIEGKGTKILIDVGFYLNVIEERLSDAGISSGHLNGILITHEHRDHICGLNMFVQKWDIPIYINDMTYNVMKKWTKGINPTIFHNGSGFSIGDLEIKPFSLLHDAADNSGFVIKCDNKKIFYATDLGFVTSLVKERMKNSDLIVFESNHDREMLINGSYPWYLKQRILSREGHISNEESAVALKEVINNRVKEIILAHVSRENNHPDVLLDTHYRILSGTNVPLIVAPQDRISDVFEI